MIDRRLVAQFLDRQVGHHLTAVTHDEALGRRGLADDREIQPPFTEDFLGLRLLFRLEHHEHALLALGEHHFIGAHADFAARHLVEIERHAEVALGSHLRGRAGQARRAHVLDGDDAILRHDLQTRFEQQLFGEGIADLHRRPLLLGVRAELGGRHAGAVDTVTPGLGAEVDDRFSHARRLGVENPVRGREADRHGVDQAIALVAPMEADRAADRRHAERIAVAADAGDHAGDEMAGARMRRVAKAQEIQARDRARAHGEHVAQDAADPRRGALIGLDVARMVVALHLENEREAIADGDHAGVLAGPLDHPRRLGG